MAYKFLEDNTPEEDIMSEMPLTQQNRLANIPPTQPETQIEPLPKDLQEQLFSAPKLADVVSPKPEQPEAPMLAEAETQPIPPQAPMSEVDRLQKMLEGARKSDRTLKIGAALGDALATYINAEGQKNVMAPGAQVQQGAGLGKIADMFATAPDIQSDIKSRREDLLAQYKLLAKDKNLKDSPSAWQIVPVVKNGIQQYVSVNKITNEMRPIGEKATYQQFRVEPNTGNIVAYNPVSGAQATSSTLPEKKESSATEVKAQEPKIEEPVDLAKEAYKKLNPNQKEAVKETIKYFNDDTKDARNSLSSISNLRKTLDMSTDNRAAAKAFGTQLAKVFQDGRLSDKDVDLYIKDTDLIQKIRTGYFDMTKGTIDPNKIPEYRQLIKSMEDGLSENVDERADYFATQTLGKFIDDPEIRRNLIYPKQALQYKKPNENKKEQAQQQVKSKELPIGATATKKDPKTGNDIKYIKKETGWEPIK